MSGGAVLGLLAVVFGTIALLAWFLARKATRAGEMEAEAVAEARRAEATAAAAESDRKAIERMADAQAASVGEPADRIRKRMHKRPANTR